MEKRNTLILSIVGVLVFVLLGIGVWMFMSKPSGELNLYFGKAMVVGTKGEKIQVVSTKDSSSVLAEWEIPVFEILPDHNSQSLIVLTDEEPQRVMRLSFSGKSPELKQIYDIDYNYTDETEVRWIEDTGFFFEPSTKTFTVINPEQLKETTFTLENVKELDDWTAKDQFLFYAYDKKISVYDMENKKILATVSLEAPTKALFVKGDYLQVVSEFGEESGFTTVLSLDMETLAIEKLSSIKEKGLNFFNGMINDELVYYSMTSNRNRTSYESYNIVSHEADRSLALNLKDDDQAWFEKQFAYVLTEDKQGYVQSVYVTDKLWETTNETDWLYPIW